MEIGKKKNQILNYYELSYAIQQFKITLSFIRFYILDFFAILINLKKDSKKYNIRKISIVYNSLIKYPVLGYRPTDYFIFRFYENSYLDYLNFFEEYSKIIKYNKKNPNLLDNKLDFHLYINDKFDTTKIIAYYNYYNKKIIYLSKSKTDKIVIKPINGMGGKGIKIIDSYKIEEYLKKCSKNYLAEEYINQNDFLKNIFSESVNTLRVLTLKTGSKIEIVHLVLRVGRKSTFNLDNVSRGGLTIDVDVDSGLLKFGYISYEYGFCKYSIHPDTNFEFYGKSIPFFNEAKEIALNSHKLFSMFSLIGWDIAITNKGPILIEGNRIPDLSLHQVHIPLKKIFYESLFLKTKKL